MIQRTLTRWSASAENRTSSISLCGSEQEGVRRVDRRQLELAAPYRTVVERHPVDAVAAGDQCRCDPELLERRERPGIESQRVAQACSALGLVDDLDAALSVSHQGEGRGQTDWPGPDHEGIDGVLEGHTNGRSMARASMRDDAGPADRDRIACGESLVRGFAWLRIVRGSRAPKRDRESPRTRHPSCF
jgi:hypothetical protein